MPVDAERRNDRRSAGIDPDSAAPPRGKGLPLGWPAVLASSHPKTLTAVVVVVALCAVMTVAGYKLKAQCIGDFNQQRDKLLCSNDIQLLYFARGLAHHQFPYLHGGLHGGQLTGGTLEYPVLTGVFAWAAALFVNDDGTYLQVSALLLTPFTLISAYLLARLVSWRALIYALAPPLVWYSFHNWDLLVVAATVTGLHAWANGRSGQAAAWLAVGASLKLWPGFLLAPLFLDALRNRDRHQVLRILAAAATTYAAINAPFMLTNPAGWVAPYAFQALRTADLTANSIWSWGLSPPPPPGTLNHIIAIALAAAFTLACGYGWTRSRQDGSYPFIQVSAAMLAAFMLLNKAHSPQYALWLLPFFTLLRLRWGWWLSYYAIDACMYIGAFRWYYILSQGGDFGLAKQALILGVWGRATMLVLLYILFLRADLATTSQNGLTHSIEHAKTLITTCPSRVPAHARRSHPKRISSAVAMAEMVQRVCARKGDLTLRPSPENGSPETTDAPANFAESAGAAGDVGCCGSSRLLVTPPEQPGTRPVVAATWDTG